MTRHETPHHSLEVRAALEALSDAACAAHHPPVIVGGPDRAERVRAAAWAAADCLRVLAEHDSPAVRRLAHSLRRTAQLIEETQQ